MSINLNEIKERAVDFSKEWVGTKSEEADSKSFLDAFIYVFGISHYVSTVRRNIEFKKVATFEHKVKKLNEHDGYIDLFWKGTMLVEMKSQGKDLDKAYEQAKDYLQKIKQEELPKYILVSDFEIFRLHDLIEEVTHEFKLSELIDNLQHFSFLTGYEKISYKEQDPVNIKAAELMGKIHDRLRDIGYEGHPLEVYLVRLLFCLFAEDTTIFAPQAFQTYIEKRTNEDGSLAVLYDVILMPPKLSKAHQALDKAVDNAYRSQPFTTEAKRMEFLFELYEKYTADLFTKEKPKKKSK